MDRDELRIEGKLFQLAEQYFAAMCEIQVSVLFHLLPEGSKSVPEIVAAGPQLPRLGLHAGAHAEVA